MTPKEAREFLTDFAHRHGIVFDEQGECGFGRECVGLRHGNNWIDHNPCAYKVDGSLNPEIYPVEELADQRFYPPGNVDAYHKHDCLAVLGRGDEAVVQLATWILAITDVGQVEIVEYDKGARGFRAMLAGGISSPAIAYVKRPKPRTGKSVVMGRITPE